MKLQNKTINQYYENFLDNKDSIALIDVRTNQEYQDYHLEGALNIQLEEIDNYKINKNKIVYLYCRSGRRSAIAEEIYKSQGYKAINIGGIIDFLK